MKVSLNKYLQGMLSGVATTPNPVSTLVTSTTRSWTDANRNYVPDCDLTNPALQDNRAAGGDFCGAMVNANFGKVVPGATFDPDLAARLGQAQLQLGVLGRRAAAARRRVSADVSYFRRWYGNFTVTDNLVDRAVRLRSVQHHRAGRSAAAGRRRLRHRRPLRPESGQVRRAGQNFVTLSRQLRQADRALERRRRQRQRAAQGGVLVQGGVSTGRTSTDNCDVVAKLDNPSPLYCHVDTAFLTQVKVLGSYLDPARRRAGERHVPEHSRPGDPGQLHRAQRRRRAVARPDPVRQRRQRRP